MNSEQDVESLLVVEDDMALRPLWAHFFEVNFRNINVDWAVSGEEAIKMIHHRNQIKNPYRLIITDIFLAGSKTGLDLLNSKELRKSRTNSVLISSVDSDEIKNKFGNLVLNSVVLSKPINFKKFKPIFRKLLTPEIGSEHSTARENEIAREAKAA